MEAPLRSGADQLQRVSGLDAAFLHTETPSTHWHVLGVAILDPSTASEPFDASVMRRVLADRIHRVDVFRRRVVDQAVGGYSQPHWLPTDVDLDIHVTSVVLPDGSGTAELAALAGEMGSTPLSRDRPLWEFAVVEGLADGHCALLAKIHHALVDGVAAVGVLGAIFDTEPIAAPPLPEQLGTPAPEVPRREYLTAAARTVKNQPAIVARSVTRLAGTSWRVMQRIARREPSGTLPLTAPRTCLSSSITSRRATAFATIDVDAVKEIRQAFGVTFNDVVLAVAAGALREWLRSNGDLPDRPLVAAIPTSVRADKGGMSGNEVSMLFGALPTHLADPAARVRFIAQEMPGAKAFHEELGPRTLGSLATVAPWNLASALFRAYSNLDLANRLRPVVNLTLTSVPGPRVPLYCAGARLESLFPLGPIFDGAALNITALSYTDRVSFGLIACPDVCPPVEHLADAIPTVLNDLVAAARAAELGQELAMDVQERNRAALDAVQERRDEFYEGILGLERAMATAAGDDPVAWAQAVTTAVGAMHTVLDDHIAETEAAGGFYDDVIQHAPNLIKAAERLRDEHPPLVSALDQLNTEVQGVTDDESVERARQTALEVIKALFQHRHRGAELVYDAYNIDVATGD